MGVRELLQLDEHHTRIEEYFDGSMRHLVAAQWAAFYFATFDAGDGGMDDRGWDDVSEGAFFRNFLSGMS
jgi:hypothetical protein